jgi:hypothetical protein
METLKFLLKEAGFFLAELFSVGMFFCQIVGFLVLLLITFMMLSPTTFWGEHQTMSGALWHACQEAVARETAHTPAPEPRKSTCEEVLSDAQHSANYQPSLDQ